MDSKAVSREIRRHVWPLLRAEGFSRFTTRTAWRTSDGKIDVLNFQSFNAYNASVMGVTPFSFSVNLGSFLTYVPPQWPPKLKDGHPTPDEAECQFRRRLMRGFTQANNQHADVWNVDDQGRNLLSCVRDVIEQLPEAMTWFSRLTDKSEVLSVLINQDEDMSSLWGFGSKPSPNRSYLTGYVALAVGKHDLAREKLQEAVQSDCFTTLFKDVEAAVGRAA